MGKKKESKLVKYLLIGISILFLFVMLVLPLIVVVTEALKKGWQVYVEAVTDSFTIAALMLTLKATVIAVLCNTVLGLCAAWAVTRFQFKGKKFLMAPSLFLSMAAKAPSCIWGKNFLNSSLLTLPSLLASLFLLVSE